MKLLQALYYIALPFALSYWAFLLWGDDWKTRILAWRQYRALRNDPRDGRRRLYPMRWNQFK